MGIDPQNLGHFKVRVFKLRWETRKLSDSEHESEVAEQKALLEKPRNPPLQAKEQNLWDARKVDEDSFKKDGLNYAVG